MCGIAGVHPLTDVTRRMLPYLAWEIEGRGRDSWGMTNGRETIKYLGPITHTWQNAVDDWATWNTAIIHTRAASTGEVSIENQHPFSVYKIKPGTEDAVEKVIVGIHNGIVTNHDELNKKHDRKFDVDTRHIFEALVGNSPTYEIQGYGNCAWYEMTEERPEPVLHLLKFNADALHVAKLETGEMVFCSTRDPIERAAWMAGSKMKTFYTVEGDTEYLIGPPLTEATEPGMVLYRVDKRPFGYRWSQGESMASRNGNCGTPWVPLGNNHCTDITHLRGRRQDIGYYPLGNGTKNIQLVGTTARNNELCGAKGCNNKVTGGRRKALICDDCFTLVCMPIERRVGLVGQ